MLDEKFVQKAFNELKETEETKQSSLEEFRKWLSKHDLFKNCRQDEKFLLQFLRTKKYNMERAIDLFERYMLLKSTYPKWYNISQEEEDKMWSLYDTGFIYPLIDRDVDGRRVILVQIRKLDPQIFTFADILRLITRIAQILLEEEETQVSGFVVISDFTNTTMAHIKLFPISHVISFVEIIRTCAVGRHKLMIMVALPNFAALMLEAAKRVMGEKLRKRIKLIKTMDEIENEINMSLLPQEYGGTVSEAVMIEKFRQIAVERSDLIKEINDGVDWDKVALEVDTCTIT